MTQSRSLINYYIIWLFSAWVIAILIFQTLQSHTELLSSNKSTFIYWTVMRVFIWVLPAIIIIHQLGKHLIETFGFTRIRSTIIWSAGIGLILLLLNIVVKPNILTTLPPLSYQLITIVFVAPIVEEIAFRGAILPALIKQYNNNFILANTITALLFLAIHIPGWWFQGQLSQMLLLPIGGAISIFLLGWLFGYIAYKSQSLLASIIVHSINNLLSIY